MCHKYSWQKFHTQNNYWPSLKLSLQLSLKIMNPRVLFIGLGVRCLSWSKTLILIGKNELINLIKCFTPIRYSQKMWSGGIWNLILSQQILTKSAKCRLRLALKDLALNALNRWHGCWLDCWCGVDWSRSDDVALTNLLTGLLIGLKALFGLWIMALNQCLLFTKKVIGSHKIRTDDIFEGRPRAPPPGQLPSLSYNCFNNL